MAWQNETTIYLIMWKSSVTGATLSDIKKSKAGKDRFVEMLEFIGVDMDTVKVVEQEKPYKYVPKKERAK
ncbi:hypothetical protein ACSHUI_00005 [Bacillus subtilis]|uniref:hypothetical protein n=1 Tax=Bacillus subtilis TaxID=1423 RepID=UPI0025C779DA|nr:hypothetical protein [Bacillus subtilis]GLI90905.1 hypothetical protein ANABIO4_42570 [Bacillus subtilis]